MNVLPSLLAGRSLSFLTRLSWLRPGTRPNPDEAILEYVLGEPRAYCLRITRENIPVIVLPAGRRRIESLADDYLEGA